MSLKLIAGLSLAMMAWPLASHLTAGSLPPAAGRELTSCAITVAPDAVCAKCGAKMSADAKFCPGCGAKVESPRPAFCPACGKPVKPDALFCGECGAKLAPPTSLAAPAQPPPAPEMEKYQSKDGRVLLFRPKDWAVEDGEKFGPGIYAVGVHDKDDTGLMMFMTFSANEQIKTSADLALACMDNMAKAFGDVKVSDMKSTPDKARTEVTMSLTVEGKKAVGHAYFFHTARVSSVYFLLARADLWEKLRPTLTLIAANMAYTPEGVDKVLKQGQEQAGKGEFADGGKLSPAEILRLSEKKPGKQLPLEAAVAADGSFTMQMPKGWVLDGSGLYYTLTNDNRAKEYGCGFMRYTFSTVDYGQPIPGVVTSPYRPPTQALAFVFSLGKVGKNVQILGESFDNELPAETVRGFKALDVTGTRTDVRLVHVKFTNATTGRPERGLFIVSSTATPMGISWDCCICGGWAPGDDLEDCLPLYGRLGKTAQANQQWVAANNGAQQAKSQQLFNNLQDSIKGQQKSFEGYMGSLKDASRSRDYTSWAVSQTTLGQGSWVAENEGAKVYHTDSWGIEGPEGRVDKKAYNNTYFDGKTPWGQDTSLINTRQMWEKHIAK